MHTKIPQEVKIKQQEAEGNGQKYFVVYFSPAFTNKNIFIF